MRTLGVGFGVSCSEGADQHRDLILSQLLGFLPAGVRLELRVKRNRKGLLGLRGTPTAWVLTLHPDLTSDPEWSVCIGEWLRRRGRGGAGKPLRDLLARVRRRHDQPGPEEHTLLAALPVVGPTLDLNAELARMHDLWFSDLRRPQIRWSRQPPRRRLSHLRFGCYRRALPGTIELSPRLNRPWIARCFVEHVLHHELCHHRQAATPLARREPPHSRRFKTWERTYPQLDQALSWEHRALPWLLDDAPPPWYVTTQDPP